MVQISKMFRLERHFFLIRPNFTEFLQFSREELKIRFGMSSILNKNPYKNVFEIDELLKNAMTQIFDTNLLLFNTNFWRDPNRYLLFDTNFKKF